MIREIEKKYLSLLREEYLRIKYVVRSSSAKYKDHIRLKIYDCNYKKILQTVRYNDIDFFNELEIDRVYDIEEIEDI